MSPSSRRRLLTFAGLLAVTLVAPTGVLHMTIYTILLILFATTLRPGHTALATRLARQMRGGTLPDDLVRYTRRVTWAWTLFCAAQLIASAALYIYGARTTWAFFVTFLNLPLVLLMAGAEYGYRRLRFRHHAHVSPGSMLKLMRGPWMRR